MTYVKKYTNNVQVSSIPLLDNSHFTPGGEIVNALGLISFLVHLASSYDFSVYVRQRDGAVLVHVREAAR